MEATSPAMDGRPTTAVGPPRRRTWNSLLWALLVPLLFTLAGWLAQYPFGLLYVGVFVALGVLAVAATLAGAVWGRPGAAVLVSCSGLALTFFAGPGLYEAYMKTLGTPVAAVVMKAEDQDNRRGSDMSCTVVEIGGGHTVHHLSEQQNCDDRFKPMQAVELRADPMGLLKPRLPDAPDRGGVTSLTLGISAGLFLLTGATLLYAGRRRRKS